VSKAIAEPPRTIPVLRRPGRLRPGLALYIARRLVALVAVVIVVSFLVFAMVYAAPGSVENTLLGPRNATPEAIAAIRSEFHLDEPLHEQYAIWLGDAVRMDFGRSLLTNEPVIDEIWSRLPLSLELAVGGFVVALIGGVALGVLAAIKRGSAIDQAAVLGGVIGISTPAFVTGIALLYIFGYQLGWFPIYGSGDGVLDRAWHLVLPSLALGLTELGVLLRLTRASMIAALQQDAIVFARARGLPSWRVNLTYGLRTALIPITTGAGLVLPVMLAGAVLVEVAFSLPGVGRLLVEAVNGKDVPTIQGLTILIAVVVGIVNLALDLLYLRIDPRINFGKVHG
jgi:peptide/nickel transport system permease protein